LAIGKQRSRIDPLTAHRKAEARRVRQPKWRAQAVAADTLETEAVAGGRREAAHHRQLLATVPGDDLLCLRASRQLAGLVTLALSYRGTQDEKASAALFRAKEGTTGTRSPSSSRSSRAGCSRGPRSALRNLRNRYALLDKQRADSTYLVGDRFTVADACLFVVTRWRATSRADAVARFEQGPFVRGPDSPFPLLRGRAIAGRRRDDAVICSHEEAGARPICHAAGLNGSAPGAGGSRILGT